MDSFAIASFVVSIKLCTFEYIWNWVVYVRVTYYLRYWFKLIYFDRKLILFILSRLLNTNIWNDNKKKQQINATIDNDVQVNACDDCIRTTSNVCGFEHEWWSVRCGLKCWVVGCLPAMHSAQHSAIYSCKQQQFLLIRTKTENTRHRTLDHSVR